MNGNSFGKLFVFALLLLPPCLALVGIVPLLLITFGLVMFKRTREFSHIETAARNSRIWCYLVATGLVVLAAYWYSHRGDFDWYLDNTYWCLFWSVVTVAYAYIVNKLFLEPLQDHREWIEQHGIFGKAASKASTQSSQSQIDIIGRQDLRTFSVADELLKWAKLKQDGLVTEAEFDDARAKLLNK